MIDSQTTSTHEYSIRTRDLAVDRDVLERILGYDKSPAPGPVTSFLDEAIRSIPEYIDPRCALRILPSGSCSFGKRTLSVDGVDFQTHPIISKRLRSSESVAFFVCTIGPRLEQRARRLMDEGKMLEGFLLDQIASEVVEQAADWAEKKLSETVQPMGWMITNRYSPGYCGWSVSEQQKLFSFLPIHICGIELTASSFMIPIKSVSGIIGLGPKAMREAYECSVCDMTNCFRRKR